MNKNIFDQLEVFAPEVPKVVVQEPVMNKKQQNAIKQNLRESYGTTVNKPTPNKRGSKTIKSDRDDKRPHQEVDLNRQFKKHHGANEVIEEMNQQIEELEEPKAENKTVEQYFRDQGVEVSISNNVAP